MIDIGRVGLWTGLLDAHPTARVRDLAVELEEMGWPCLWRPETSGRDALVSAAQILEAHGKGEVLAKRVRFVDVPRAQVAGGTSYRAPPARHCEWRRARGPVAFWWPVSQ